MAQVISFRRTPWRDMTLSELRELLKFIRLNSDEPPHALKVEMYHRVCELREKQRTFMVQNAALLPFERASRKRLT